MINRKKERKAPPVGSQFTRFFKGKGYKLVIVMENGQRGYKVNDVVHTSPSTAARSVTNTSVNGWTFWGIDKRTP